MCGEGVVLVVSECVSFFIFFLLLLLLKFTENKKLVSKLLTGNILLK